MPKRTRFKSAVGGDSKRYSPVATTDLSAASPCNRCGVRLGPSLYDLRVRRRGRWRVGLYALEAIRKATDAEYRSAEHLGAAGVKYILSNGNDEERAHREHARTILVVQQIEKTGMECRRCRIVEGERGRWGNRISAAGEGALGGKGRKMRIESVRKPRSVDGTQQDTQRLMGGSQERRAHSAHTVRAVPAAADRGMGGETRGGKARQKGEMERLGGTGGSGREGAGAPRERVGESGNARA
ncbi:hypothetical protein C8J57DRAFT_1488392, partial [Mycena rebaudengoi]